MKISFLKGALAFAAASLLGASAYAQLATDSDGDLMLNFSAASGQGSGYDLEVDLGNFQQYLPGGTDGAGGVVYNLSQLSISDLSTTTGAGQDGSNGGFGANWDSDGLVQWAIGGDTESPNEAGLPLYTLFGSQRSTSLTAPNGNSSQGNVDAELGAGAISDADGATTTSNSADAAFLATTDNNSWASNGGATAPYFTFFGNVFETTANGTSSANLYEIKPNSTGVEVGTFTLSPTGLTYQAVPEPSTWATILLGAAALVGFRRRRA